MPDDRPIVSHEEQINTIRNSELRDMDYRCDECPASYRFMDQYVNHLKMQHGWSHERATQHFFSLGGAQAKAKREERKAVARAKSKAFQDDVQAERAIQLKDCPPRPNLDEAIRKVREELEKDKEA